MLDSYNSEILNRNIPKERIIIPLNKEGTDTDFETLFKRPDFLRIFGTLLEGYGDFKKDNPEAIVGFNIFGSWINGQPNPTSDIDTCFLLPDYFGFEKSRYFSTDEIHVICKSGEEDVVMSYVRSIIKNPDYSKNEIHDLKFILNGLSFGKESQFFQKRILDYIRSLNESDRKIFWDIFSKDISRSESGYPTLRGHKQKYWLVSLGQLTFEEFVERWQKRCEFTNRFCEENGIKFD